MTYLPSTTGYDLALDEENGYDLKVNSEGDVQTVFGSDSLTESLIRRSLTPKGGFARYIQTGDNQWETIGIGFGNKLSFYISQSNPDLEAIQEEVFNVLSQDERIKIQSVQVKEGRPIEVDVQYRFRDQDVVKNESLTLG
jgi:hypothetical protein